LESLLSKYLSIEQVNLIIKSIFHEGQIDKNLNINEIINIITKNIPKNENKEEKPLHLNVSCDGCKQTPIKGIRFKCNNCDNFDFCEECVKTKKDLHGKDHTFTTINNPVGSLEYWIDFLKDIQKEFEKQNEKSEKDLPKENEKNKVEIVQKNEDDYIYVESKIKK